jgi:hypothetical protein
MFKFFLAAAPYFLKAPSQNSQKQIARSFTVLVLFAVSGISLLGALFIYITSIYGAALGLLCIGTVLFLAGLFLYFKAKKGTVEVTDNLPMAATSDPVAAILPNEVMRDPRVTKVLAQIAENPLASTVAAASIGMIISRELFKD